MHVLTEADVRASIDMEAALALVRRALVEHAEGRTDTPLRAEIRIPDRGVLGLFMPAHVPSFSAFGTKIIAEFPANADQGLPVLTGSLALLDYETGLVSALMGATYLTNLRTGALTGVAASCLAPEGARVAAVLGTGGIAPGQAQGLAQALELDEIRVWGRRPERVDDVVRQLAREPLPAQPTVRPVDSARDAVSGAQVVVTATSATAPIVEDAWVADGTLLCAMGSNAPHMQELPVSLMGRAQRVVADTRAGVIGRSGDVVKAVQEGALDPEAVDELSEVVAGARPGRQRPDDVIVFKSCGFAALDIALAAEVYRLAQEGGLGQVIDLGQEQG